MPPSLHLAPYCAYRGYDFPRSVFFRPPHKSDFRITPAQHERHLVLHKHIMIGDRSGQIGVARIDDRLRRTFG